MRGLDGTFGNRTAYYNGVITG